MLGIGQVPNPIWLILFIKRGYLETAIHTEKQHVKMKAETGVIILQTQGTPKIANFSQEPGEKQGGLLSEASRRANAADTLILNF